MPVAGTPTARPVSPGRGEVWWLGDQLAENRPYDQIVREVIGGTGLWTDSPAVNFLTVTAGDDNNGQPNPVRLAGRTTRAFLGMRIDCLQCHDDPMGIDFTWELETPVGRPMILSEGSVTKQLVQ